MKTRSRLLVPEIVQTSNMDCGPAALKCLLEGFGIATNYARLREACQTGVDGTSIDTLEETANVLGLKAEQIMVPLDHVLLEESASLPAIAVVLLPNGAAHFVVLWRKHGRYFQIMDPAVGRRFVPAQRLLADLYQHRMDVPAEDWRTYAGSSEFVAALAARMAALQLPSDEFIASALADLSWRGIATLDGAVRAAAALVTAGALKPGAEAVAAVSSLLSNPDNIPTQDWCVRPASAEQLTLTGAVLVRALGRQEMVSHPESAELAAALGEPSIQPGASLWKLLGADGWLAPASLVAALFVSAAALLFEAFLFRGLLDAALGTVRSTALAAVAVFAVTLLLWEWPLALSLRGMGRRLEIRLRISFLRKLPRLPDRYLQSRLRSDLAERGHNIHLVRRLPELGGQLLRLIFELVLTAGAICWLDPPSAIFALVSAAGSIVIPWLSQPLLIERDLRLRTHSGALSNFYLDGLLGLFAIHSHRAQPGMRAQHEALLVYWARAGLRLQRLTVAIEALQLVLGFGLAAWLLYGHATAGATLLLVYWALNLPVLGQEVAALARQYPSVRNITLRLLEPLSAVERTSASEMTPVKSAGAAAIDFDNVQVKAGGHVVLAGLSLNIRPGEHVAIVGPSGAGKSTMVGLLLGWHTPVQGAVLVDGAVLDEAGLDRLRAQTAWLDPAVQLWNMPLEDNIRYGSAGGAKVADAKQAGGLERILARLPEGNATLLGEGGGLVSGGEGQRVRFARAWARPDVRLAILDEPFRGLDLESRHALLTEAREHWRDATLLCITHDVAETLAFQRVLVLENGGLAEDGDPHVLASDPHSRFSALLAAERDVRQRLWSGPDWRHLRLETGRLLPEGER